MDAGVPETSPRAQDARRRRAGRSEHPPLFRREFVGEPALGVDRRHTAGTGRRDRLPVDRIHRIASGKDTLHIGVTRTGCHLDIADWIELQLALHELRVGFVADCDEGRFNR